MSTNNGFVLGIDLGANSLGVALIDAGNQRLVHTGVRIFEAGVANLDTAKEQSKNTERRMARQVRRQTERRQRRFRAVFRVLQESGLLPPGKRQEVLEALDRDLSKQFSEFDKLPYLLRTRALHQKLEPFAIGRALYHLGQRRGFLSNKKAQGSKDEAEERSKVKKQIEGLWEAIHASGCETLGEYFYRHVDPHSERIRKRFTHRDMYKQEFDRIWNRQSSEDPELLTHDLRQRLEHAIFYQRPLKDQKDKVGKCELVPGEYRAPVALLEVQRLRMLLAVNNLRLFERQGAARPLTKSERDTILSMAESGETLNLTSAKKKLKLHAHTKFSVESGGETKMPANATAARLRKAIGKDWDRLNEEQRTDLVDRMLAASGTEEELQTELSEAFGFDEATARAVSLVSLPQGYYSISRKAVKEILPYLEGERPLDFTTARREAYGDPPQAEPLDLLPPVESCLPEVRNPIVMRSLTELRKTVNAVIRKFGKPDVVRVELARDIKRGHEERMKLSKRMRDRESERDRAKKELAKYMNCEPADVKRRDVDKWLLWEECKHQCPYTGRHISMEALFGPNPLFQIEHIIPLSRSLDDSFNNKTLCSNEMNALKGNRSPWNVFGPTDEWDAMVERVRGFGNPYKLSRFTLTEDDEEALLSEFTERQLNDTRYASRLAARYLSVLFGGENDAEGRKRVFTCAGQVTALLRREWRLNGILNEHGELKSRDDHRHHAVDAVAVAMSSPRTIKALSDAAERAGSEHRLRFGGYFALPWERFRDDVADAIRATNVSLRPDYKLLDQMHDQTLYTKAWLDGDGKRYVTIRKPLDSDGVRVDDIIDPQIRAAVRAKIEELGTAKKLASDWPRDAAGRQIKKVRVRVSVNTDPTVVGEGASARHVMPNSIHHTEILRDETVKGKVRYRHVTVTTIEAMRRKRAKEPIVQKDHGERMAFVCSLRPGDVIEVEKASSGLKELWRVRSLNMYGQFAMHNITDSRRVKDIRDDKSIWKPVVNTCFLGGAAKVRILHDGAVVSAND